MAEHNFVGKIGEELAREHLEKNGYKILEQNYKTKYAEIDLVAEKSFGFFGKKSLVFVEVRTKIGENFGAPEDTLDKNKLRKVMQNAMAYSAFKKWQGPCRIDAICIVLKPDFSVSRLTHHENIVTG
jgi:putative endonuclease